jgi:hypothetical protein
MGCMPRGPFPVAAFFGEGDGSGCLNGNCCSSCGARGDHLAKGAPNNAPAGPPPVAAPIANFLPVPTRPVFTPWMSDEPDAPEVTGPLAWLQAIAPPASDNADNPPRIEERSPGPIAERPRPSPLPETGESIRPTPEWHAAAAK